MIQRTNQGGSVATFIVIGVILFVGLAGSVYFVNQRGQQARKSQTIATADKTNSNSSSTSKTNTNNKPVSTPSSSDKTSQAKTQNLPASGPELSILKTAGIYLLVASGVAFVLSRRLLSARSL